MPALSELGRLRFLAEIFIHAIKIEPGDPGRKGQIAVENLMEFGCTERQAQSFLDKAQQQFDRQMLREPSQILDDIVISFRRRDHDFILGQIQDIIEAGEINDNVQIFYDLCLSFLFPEEEGEGEAENE